MGLVLLVSIYTVRILLEALGIEDYGIYSAVGGVIYSLSFVSATLTIASQRFFSIEIGRGNLNSLNDIFNGIFILYLVIGLILLIGFETLGIWFLNNKMTIPPDKIYASRWVFQLTIISFIITLIISPFQSLIIAYEKMNIYAVIGLVDVFVKLGLTFLISHLQNNRLILYALFLLGETLICQLFSIVYCKYKVYNCKINIHFDKEIIKPVFEYSKWSVFGSLAYVSNNQGINLILNVFWGPLYNAAYAIGNQVRNAVSLFGSNFFMAVRPAMIKEYSAKNENYFMVLFFFSSKMIFILLFIFVMPLLLESESIMKIWLKEVTPSMVNFTQLMLIIALVLSLSEPITTAIQAAGMVKKYHICVDGFVLMTLPSIYICFRFGLPPISALFVSLILLIIAHFIRLKIVKPIINLRIMDYVKNVLCPIGLTILISSTIGYIISVIFPSSIMGMILKCILQILLVILIAYAILLTKQEKEKLKQMIGIFIRQKRSVINNK